MAIFQPLKEGKWKGWIVNDSDSQNVIYWKYFSNKKGTKTFKDCGVRYQGGYFYPYDENGQCKGCFGTLKEATEILGIKK